MKKKTTLEQKSDRAYFLYRMFFFLKFIFAAAIFIFAISAFIYQQYFMMMLRGSAVSCALAMACTYAEYAYCNRWLSLDELLLEEVNQTLDEIQSRLGIDPAETDLSEGSF